MADDPKHLAQRLERIATELRQLPARNDWIDAYLAGEILLTDQAADIAGVSSETIRRRCEAAAATNRPLGILLAGSVWAVSRQRLLDSIEVREGKPAMLAAATRAEKYTAMRASPQESLRRVAVATR
jgi:hypothetical protein